MNVWKNPYLIPVICSIISLGIQAGYIFTHDIIYNIIGVCVGGIPLVSVMSYRKWKYGKV